jgi:hypothetical protein
MEDKEEVRGIGKHNILNTTQYNTLSCVARKLDRKRIERRRRNRSNTKEAQSCCHSPSFRVPSSSAAEPGTSEETKIPKMSLPRTFYSISYRRRERCAGR